MVFTSDRLRPYGRTSTCTACQCQVTTWGNQEGPGQCPQCGDTLPSRREQQKGNNGGHGDRKPQKKRTAWEQYVVCTNTNCKNWDWQHKTFYSKNCQKCGTPWKKTQHAGGQKDATESPKQRSIKDKLHESGYGKLLSDIGVSANSDQAAKLSAWIQALGAPEQEEQAEEDTEQREVPWNKLQKECNTASHTLWQTEQTLKQKETKAVEVRAQLARAEQAAAEALYAYRKADKEYSDKVASLKVAKGQNNKDEHKKQHINPDKINVDTDGFDKDPDVQKMVQELQTAKAKVNKDISDSEARLRHLIENKRAHHQTEPPAKRKQDENGEWRTDKDAEGDEGMGRLVAPGDAGDGGGKSSQQPPAAGAGAPGPTQAPAAAGSSADNMPEDIVAESAKRLEQLAEKAKQQGAKLKEEKGEHCG